MFPRAIVFAGLLALASAPWGSLAAQPKCYFPNGSEIQNSNTTYEACNGIAGATSQCCATSEGCSANGLCVSTEGQYSRGGCTDPTFRSPFCLSICTSILLGGKSSGAADVHECTDGTWCCGDGNSTASECCIRREGITLPATIGIDKGDSATMSNTVKVSIGAGIGAAAIISLGIVSFVYWRRRHQRKRELEQQLAILSPTRSDHGLLPFSEEPRSEKGRREMVRRPEAARLSS